MYLKTNQDLKFMYVCMYVFMYVCMYGISQHYYII